MATFLRNFAQNLCVIRQWRRLCFRSQSFIRSLMFMQIAVDRFFNVIFTSIVYRMHIHRLDFEHHPRALNLYSISILTLFDLERPNLAIQPRYIRSNGHFSSVHVVVYQICHGNSWEDKFSEIDCHADARPSTDIIVRFAEVCALMHALLITIIIILHVCFLRVCFFIVSNLCNFLFVRDLSFCA